MNPMETIITALGANALVIAALAYLMRSLIGHRLEKDISEFKRTLELTAQREIEAFKAQLEKDRLRLQISYGGIFEKQAGAILELYRNVLALERAASKAVNSGEPIPQRKTAFRDALSKIRRSYHEDRILLPQHIDEMVGHFMDRMFRSVLEVANLESRDFSRVTEEEFKKLSEREDKAYEIVESELPTLRENLIVSMRRTVGVVGQDAAENTT